MFLVLARAAAVAAFTSVLISSGIDARKINISCAIKAYTTNVSALARAVAVAALPVVFWLPGVFTPGKLISALPSKKHSMVRAVVKVVALPVILPLILLENVETPLTSRVLQF